jgi:hypothetical protein
MPRRLPENGPTEQLLLGLLLEPGSLRSMHPWLARAARAALRRGLVERVVGGDALIAITNDGRARLGLPEPGALRAHDPIEVLNVGQLVAYGYVRYPLRAPTGDEGTTLVARVLGVEVPHRAMHLYLDLTARVAREHGVRCVASFDGAGRFWGFLRTPPSRSEAADVL